MRKSSLARAPTKQGSVKVAPLGASALESLRNLGPESARMLEAAGIASLEDLRDLGSVGAYVAVKRAGHKPTLNLLYSIEGVLRDVAWTELPYHVKASLTLEADAYLDAEGLR